MVIADIDPFVGLCDLIILILTFVSVRKMIAEARARAQSPRAHRVLQICRIATYMLGVFIILASLRLAILKVIHIRQAPSAQGVITGVQHSSHTIAPYSFYLELNAARR